MGFGLKFYCLLIKAIRTFDVFVDGSHPKCLPQASPHQEVSPWLSSGMPRWVTICHLSRGDQLRTATSGVTDMVGENKDF